MALAGRDFFVVPDANTGASSPGFKLQSPVPCGDVSGAQLSLSRSDIVPSLTQDDNLRYVCHLAWDEI